MEIGWQCEHCYRAAVIEYLKESGKRRKCAYCISGILVTEIHKYPPGSNEGQALIKAYQAIDVLSETLRTMKPEAYEAWCKERDAGLPYPGVEHA